MKLSPRMKHLVIGIVIGIIIGFALFYAMMSMRIISPFGFRGAGDFVRPENFTGFANFTRGVRPGM